MHDLPMNQAHPAVSVAERLAERIVALDTAQLPAAVRTKCEDLALDVIGLAVAARTEDYVKAALAGWDDDGPCTAIGHARTLSAAGAAFVNGTAVHGEDFDDTFEGGPVHAGAVIVPGVLAACERHNPRRRVRACWHRHRRRDTVPAQPRRAQAGAQGRLPSDRGAGRHGGGRRHRRRAETRPRPDRQCARHRRQHGLGHHRISRRWRLDQAPASRLGGASGPARGAAGEARLPRPAHRVRRHARLLPRLRQYDARRLRAR